MNISRICRTLRNGFCFSACLLLLYSQTGNTGERQEPQARQDAPAFGFTAPLSDDGALFRQFDAVCAPGRNASGTVRISNAVMHCDLEAIQFVCDGVISASDNCTQ